MLVIGNTAVTYGYPVQRHERGRRQLRTKGSHTAPQRGPQLLTPRPRSTFRANLPRPPQKQVRGRSTRLKRNLRLALALLSRVLRLGLLRLRSLSLQYRLRQLPPLWIRIRAPHVNRVHAHIQDVPVAEALILKH